MVSRQTIIRSIYKLIVDPDRVLGSLQRMRRGVTSGVDDPQMAKMCLCTGTFCARLFLAWIQEQGVCSLGQ
jgi:hypothetical protein